MTLELVQSLSNNDFILESTMVELNQNKRQKPPIDQVTSEMNK